MRTGRDGMVEIRLVIVVYVDPTHVELSELAESAELIQLVAEELTAALESVAYVSHVLVHQE
jgi:hypothetical protein